MAKAQGVGLPVRSWRCTWGPHARSSGWIGGPCPATSFIHSAADPWLVVGDPDHQRHRNTIPSALFAPYLGLRSDQRCWQGGAAGVSPHDTTSGPLLVAAFDAGNLGDPEVWTGHPNQQEIYLLSVSAEAYQYVQSRAPQQPAPPPTPDPPAPPPPTPDPHPPTPPPVDPGGLERRVSDLELFSRAASADLRELFHWMNGPNTLNQHPDFEGLVRIFSRRVGDIEEWRLAAESDLLALGRRVEALEAKAHTHQSPGPPPAPPSPPQPPGPEPGEKLLGRLSLPGAFYRATAEEPSRAYVVAIEGAPRTVGRVEISFSVKVAGDLDDGRRREIYSAAFNGRGQDGIVGYLFVDGRRNAGVFRAGDAWDPAKGRFSKESLRLPGTKISVDQSCVWGEVNAVGVGVSGATGHIPSPTTPKRSLVVNFGIPAKYADANPQEATSVGFVWSNLEVLVYA